MRATKKRLAEIEAGSPLTAAEQEWTAREFDRLTDNEVRRIIGDLLREIKNDGPQDVLDLENSIRCASEFIHNARMRRAMRILIQDTAA